MPRKSTQTGKRIAKTVAGNVAQPPKDKSRQKKGPSPVPSGTGGFMPRKLITPEAMVTIAEAPVLTGGGPFTPFALAEQPAVRHLVGPQVRFPNGAMRGSGWLPDIPDRRDSTLDSMSAKLAGEKDKVEAYKKTVGRIVKGLHGKKLPDEWLENKEWCSPVEDQGNLGSCTAHAAIGMVEYMQRLTGHAYTDASRLFVYKVTRKLMGMTGDTGAYLRTTMKALVLFGVAPEEEWPYQIASFDEEPSAYLYSYAQSCKALQYLRLDPSGKSPDEVLRTIKAALVARFTVMFGFAVYESIGGGPDIPYPGVHEKVVGGHAVLAVGYDNDHENIGTKNRGALQIRNSWGSDWGDEGYGWLPYDYVLDGLADDMWTCTQLAWVESKEFAE